MTQNDRPRPVAQENRELATLRAMTRLRNVDAKRGARAVLAIVSTITLFIAGWPYIIGTEDVGFLSFTFLILLATAPSVAFWMVGNRRDRAAVGAVIKVQLPGTVPCLLEAMDIGGERTRAEIRNALISLLPGLTREVAAEAFTVEARARLHNLLLAGSPQLTMPALSALAQMGDATALPYVSSMAAGRGIPRSLGDVKPQVQDAAIRAQDAIGEYQASLSQRQSLLRASSGPSDEPTALVRAASRTTETAPAELLRPEEHRA